MKHLRRKGLLPLLVSFAFVVFTGDLIVDSVADWCDVHCGSQASQSAPGHEKAPCSHCSCATHIGAAIAADFAVRFGRDLQPATFLQVDNEAAPPGLAASIDHPPQLG